MFLVRKKNTGDFYAMKVIKKSQAIARNRECAALRCAAAGPRTAGLLLAIDRPADGPSACAGRSVASVCRAR